MLLCLLSIRAVCLVLKTMPGTQYMLKGQSLRASSPIKRSHVFMSYISIPISFVGPLGFSILLSPGGLYRFYLQATCFMALVGASGDHWLKSRAAGERGHRTYSLGWFPVVTSGWLHVKGRSNIGSQFCLPPSSLQDKES